MFEQKALEQKIFHARTFKNLCCVTSKNLSCVEIFPRLPPGSRSEAVPPLSQFYSCVFLHVMDFVLQLHSKNMDYFDDIKQKCFQQFDARLRGGWMLRDHLNELEGEERGRGWRIKRKTVDCSVYVDQLTHAAAAQSHRRLES